MYERRDILKTVAAVPLATLLASPSLARAAASSLESVSLTVPSGVRVRAAVAYPDITPAPVILLVHEWWGLNDQIKTVAAEYARMGYMAVAVDLYGGNVTTVPAEARSYMQQVSGDVATETLMAWMSWARASNSSTDKLGTVGWCFGGGWSLNASIAAPAEATVIYYGNVARTAADLKKLEGPVLGHFASRDNWITKDMVAGFTREMKKAGQPAPIIHWYEADHAFANPSNRVYDKADAKLAWARTADFFAKNLG